MKICSICNSPNNDDSKFCLACGNLFAQPNPQINQQTRQQTFHSNPQQTVTPKIEIRPTGNGRFVNADEYVIATLENGIAMNLISGEGFRREDAILTNRRLYYNHKDGIINVKEAEEKVNVKDITGTKIASYSPYGFLVLSIIFFVFGIILSAMGAFAIFFSLLTPAIVFLVLFFSLKKKFLRIEYAGGSINFSVKKYGMQNIQAFQKSIHSVKDYIEDTK